MTPEQITLVQESWSKVVPIADKAADLFYSKLFEMDPSLRRMFPDNMAEQKKKLLAMLGKAVGSLDNLEEIVPAVQDLGRRHAEYGVRFRHYGTAAGALLWTLERGLGPSWNPAVKAAWTEAYTILSTTMYEAAQAETDEDGAADSGSAEAASAEGAADEAKANEAETNEAETEAPESEADEYDAA